MGIYSQIASAQVECQDCGNKVLRGEWNHHLDHHAGKCRCHEPMHRIRPAWLRRSSVKDLTNS